MGSSDGEGKDNERPRHEVALMAPFYRGAVPVTNAQYAAFDPSHEPEALGLRFGPLPETLRQRVDAIDSLETLTDLADRVLSARSIEDLGIA